MLIEVYTDGSATTKDKPGGWAWVIVIDGVEYSHGYGSIPNATNNDAELEAAIVGLGNLFKLKIQQDPNGGPMMDFSDITLCSDSEIILKWANGGYRFKQVAKIEKYEQLQRLVKALGVKTRWVEGHAGHEFNEKCDKLARAERRKAMGVAPKKESSKSTLMLRAIKEIAKLADKNGDPKVYLTANFTDWEVVKDICKPFLGNK